MRQVFEKEPNAALDYAEIVDADTLEPVLRLRKTCLALVAAFVGKTRLIDNALIEDCDDAISVIL
jgi:pantoate--beta-alanine ligase